MAPSITTAAIKRILQESQSTVPTPSQPPTQPTLPQVQTPLSGHHFPTPPSASAVPERIPTIDEEDDTDHASPAEPSTKQPRLTNSMNPQFFEKSAMGTAWEAQKNQPFGKDNLKQIFLTQRVFPHILLPFLKRGFLDPHDMSTLFDAMPKAGTLWKEYQRVKDLDWSPLCNPNPSWKEQKEIDPHRVDLRTAMLFHYDLDLAAVHRRTGGNHVGAHRNPEIILHQVKDLLDRRTFEHLRRILCDGCPSVFNEEASYEEYLEMYKYGNHKSVEMNLDKVMKTMNKEDRKDHVLTFPAWLTEFIPDLMLTATGFVMKQGKNDRLVFDASFLLSLISRPFNHRINMDDEPEIIFGEAWTKFLTWIYNLRITYPENEIYLFDDDVASAFRQPKYHPNVISGKAYRIGPYLFVPTGLTFGDCSSPPSFEPMARARMALSTQLSRNLQPVPEYHEYMDQVTFAPPPPPGTTFATARADRLNPGIVMPPDGSSPAAPFPTHVDDALYAAVGELWMRFLMRCSIGGLVGILGTNEPDLRAEQPDRDKFFREMVSHTRRQLGYTTNTRTMIVTIPEDKRKALLDDLVTNWGPTSGRQYFTLSEAAELLGVLVSLCRVCPWGIFLFQNLYHAMAQILTSNARRIWNLPEFTKLIEARDRYSRHPTDSSKYRFFCKKVAKVIYDARAKTSYTGSVREEIAFITNVFANPDIYRWESPIAHLIPRESDYETFQDSCLEGAGGFSALLLFWWALQWPKEIVLRTKLQRNDRHRISINLLEYAAIILGLAGSITAWEALPVDSRPAHPMILLWTDNSTAKSWTKKISGLKTPQGRSLARIFAHLLMFSDVGTEADHISGVDNIFADYLSRAKNTNDLSAFSFRQFQTMFPWLKGSRRFQPSKELLCLLITALSRPSVDIPTTRVPLGLLQTGPVILN